MTDILNEPRCIEKLVGAEIYLTDEIMGILHERRHNFPEPRVGIVGNFVEHRLGDIGLGQIAHRFVPRKLMSDDRTDFVEIVAGQAPSRDSRQIHASDIHEDVGFDCGAGKKPFVDLGILETAHAARIQTDRTHRQNEIGALQRGLLISELFGDVFIALEAFRHFGMEGPTQIDSKGALYCNNGDLVLDAAVEGAGIISMPDFVVWDSVKEGRLIPILENYIFQEVGIYAIYPPIQQLSV